jgi:hypothetical protein
LTSPEFSTTTESMVRMTAYSQNKFSCNTHKETYRTWLYRQRPKNAQSLGSMRLCL